VNGTQSRPLLRPTVMHVRRVWLTVLAATAVLIGLLAMHAIATHPGTHSAHGGSTHNAVTGTDDHQTTAGTVLTGTTAAQLIPAATAADDCAGMCGTDLCLLIGMACAMALLTAALALRSQRTINLQTTLLKSIAGRLLTIQLPAPPRPPSLLALSISRT